MRGNNSLIINLLSIFAIQMSYLDMLPPFSLMFIELTNREKSKVYTKFFTDSN